MNNYLHMCKPFPHWNAVFLSCSFSLLCTSIYKYTCPYMYIFITVLGPRGKTYWSQRQIAFFLWKQKVPDWLCSCRWLPVFWVRITPKHSHFPRRVQRCTGIAKTPCEYWRWIEIFYGHSWSRQWRSICYRSKIRAGHVKRTLKVD